MSNGRKLIKTRKLASTMVVRSEISAGDMMMMNRCKKHPKHKQSSGVCSFCLRERLSQLLVISSSKNRKHNNKITTVLSSYSSSISSTSPYSSDDDDDDDDDSTCDSPIYSHVRGGGGGRMSSMSSMKVPVSYLIKGGSTKNDVGVFTRSRSVAVVPKNWIEESNNGLKTTKKKKGGFWSKLLWSSSSKKSNKKNIKKEVVLMHSRTVREMPINSFL